MNAEQIFSIANLAAVAGWLLLVIVPQRRVTRVLVHAGAIPLLLSAAYLVLIVLFFGSAEGGFNSLAGVMRLFTNEWAVLVGWLHYLAFDLLVGAWEVRDAGERGVSHWMVIPCLVLTFVLGPIGFLMYTIVRAAFGRGGEQDAA